MVFEHLPRSYLVQKCKHALNKLRHFTKTPGDQASGVQCSFKKLLEEHFSEQVSCKLMLHFSKTLLYIGL